MGFISMSKTMEKYNAKFILFYGSTTEFGNCWCGDSELDYLPLASTSQ